MPQSEIQRKAELIMREEVLQGFEEQRVLVDALTNVSIHLGYFSFKFNLPWFLWRRSAMIPYTANEAGSTLANGRLSLCSYSVY